LQKATDAVRGNLRKLLEGQLASGEAVVSALHMRELSAVRAYTPGFESPQQDVAVGKEAKPENLEALFFRKKPATSPNTA
jgi:hypothetical protein